MTAKNEMPGVIKKGLYIELYYDAELMHGDDVDAVEWFDKKVLGGELSLFSNEIGDEIGSVKVVHHTAALIERLEGMKKRYTNESYRAALQDVIDILKGVE